MRKLLLICSILFLGVGCQSASQIQVAQDPTTIQVGEASYSIIVRDNPSERKLGLSGTKMLAQNEGMLFLFEEPQILSFWMKEMLFPLDFIWIRDEVIIGLDENIPHPAANNGEIARLESPEKADMVLEVNAGQIALNSLKIGDKVELLP